MRIATPIFILAMMLCAFPASAADEPTGKLWVDDWTGYVNQNSSQRWLRGESQRSCLSESEADEEARKAAAKELLPLVRSQLSGHSIDDSTALIQIERALQQGVAVSQKHVKRFDRPYGKIWQAWVLIDCSENSLKQLTTQVDAAYRNAIKQQRWHNRITAAWTVSLLVGISGLYFATNAATRGYFAWRLRAMAALAMIGGSVAISHLV